MSFFTNLVNLLPEIVAVVSAFIAWQSKLSACNSARVANDIQKRLLAIESERHESEQASKKQASFAIETLGRWDKSLTAFVRNIGNGTAYQAQFFVGDIRLDVYPTFKRTSLKGYEPTLEPKSCTTFEFELKSYLPSPENIVVVWTDNIGKQQRQQLDIR